MEPPGDRHPHAGVGDGATVIGTRTLASPGDAAFANAIMGRHGARDIRRQHLPSWRGGLADPARIVGTNAAIRPDVPCAAIIGYKDRRTDRRALVTGDLARLYRPTGLVARSRSVGGSYALGLAEDAAASAIAIAANTSSGLNEWPQPAAPECTSIGFAARNAIAAIELAEAGACASETILEGEAGLFAAFCRQPAPSEIPFVHRPAARDHGRLQQARSACNFAQTAAQAALRAARELGTSEEDIATVSIRVPDAAARYPGCDSKGPFPVRCRPR